MLNEINKPHKLNYQIEDDTVLYYRTKEYSKIFSITWKKLQSKNIDTIQNEELLKECKYFLSNLGFYHWDKYEYYTYDRPVYNALKSIGAKVEQKSFDSSDLVVPHSIGVDQILKRYPLSRKQSHVFIDNIDKQKWICIPFQYQPFWDIKLANYNGRTLPNTSNAKIKN